MDFLVVFVLGCVQEQRSNTCLISSNTNLYFRHFLFDWNSLAVPLGSVDLLHGVDVFSARVIKEGPGRYTPPIARQLGTLLVADNRFDLMTL